MSNKTSKMTKTAPRPIYMTSSFRGCENAKYERQTCFGRGSVARGQFKTVAR